MKKVIIALVLAGGIGYFAYASLNNHSSNKQAIEKKADKKHECKRSCMES